MNKFDKFLLWTIKTTFRAFGLAILLILVAIASVLIGWFIGYTLGAIIGVVAFVILLIQLDRHMLEIIDLYGQSQN